MIDDDAALEKLIDRLRAPRASKLGDDARIDAARSKRERRRKRNAYHEAVRLLIAAYHRGERLIHAHPIVRRWMRAEEAYRRRSVTEDAIANLAGLPPDWNSYGAGPPSQATVEEALRIVSAIGHDEYPTPCVFPTPRGGVQFEWEREDGRRFLEIEVCPDGRIAAYHDAAEDEEYVSVERARELLAAYAKDVTP